MTVLLEKQCFQLTFFNKDKVNLNQAKGGSPGLVVMGGDSCSKGCEFEFRHHILDGHLFTYLFVAKIVMCV